MRPVHGISKHLVCFETPDAVIPHVIGLRPDVSNEAGGPVACVKMLKIPAFKFGEWRRVCFHKINTSD